MTKKIPFNKRLTNGGFSNPYECNEKYDGPPPSPFNPFNNKTMKKKKNTKKIEAKLPPYKLPLVSEVDKILWEKYKTKHTFQKWLDIFFDDFLPAAFIFLGVCILGVILFQLLKISLGF